MEVSKIKLITIFEEILNRKSPGVCKNCGCGVAHSVIYCIKCGSKFFKPPQLTLFDAIKIAKNSNGRGGSCFKPYYVAAYYKIKIATQNYTEDDFINYINDKLKQ